MLSSGNTAALRRFAELDPQQYLLEVEKGTRQFVVVMFRRFCSDCEALRLVHVAAGASQEYKPSKLKIGVAHPDAVVETASLAAVEPPDITYQLHLQEQIDKGLLSSLQLESIVYASQRHMTFLPDGQRSGFFIGAPGLAQSQLEAEIHEAKPNVCQESAGIGRSSCLRMPADDTAKVNVSWISFSCGAFTGDGAGVGKGRTLAGKKRPTSHTLAVFTWTALHLLILLHAVALSLCQAVLRKLILSTSVAGLILENWMCDRKKHLWLSVGSDLRIDSRR